MVSHSIDHIENIQPPQASELLLQLGLDHFLSEPEKCTLLDAKYGAVDFNGWNNGMFLWGFFYLFSYYSILFKLMLHVFVFIDSIYIFSFVMGFFFEWYGHCFSFKILRILYVLFTSVNKQSCKIYEDFCIKYLSLLFP